MQAFPASSANLRNQGAAGTLVLLNGRRVPAHGLNGGIVGVNQIPLFAIERAEVLKDGASALCGSDAVGGVIDGQGPYDDALWDFPAARFACTWDTGRVAALQQPIRTVNYYCKATLRIDDHRIFAELTGPKADSAKQFSNLQLVPNATAQRFAFPRTAFNAAVYDRVFNQLAIVFPSLEPQRGLPIAYRWRCIECGPCEIETTSKTCQRRKGQRFTAAPWASGRSTGPAGSRRSSARATPTRCCRAPCRAASPRPTSWKPRTIA